MKYLKQLFIISAFSLLGELLAAVIPLPIPAAIYGLILLFIALCTGILKLESVSQTAHYLISIMPFFFVAPTVNLLRYWGIISPALVPICVIVAVSTVVVFAVAGVVTQLLRKKDGGKNG